MYQARYLQLKTDIWHFPYIFAYLNIVCLCVVSDFYHPMTVEHQAPLYMEFSRQEYWSG